MLKVSSCVKRLRDHIGLSSKAFGKALGVSHTAVLGWEHGEGVSPFNLMRLLAFAQDNNAPPEIIESLQAIQPEVRA